MENAKKALFGKQLYGTPNLKLKNITVIVDNNNLQQTGSTKKIMNTESLEDKWEKALVERLLQ